MTDITTGKISDLMKNSKGYDWHKVNTTTRQDKAIATVFLQANHVQDFNLLTNNCAVMTEKAYSAARHPIAFTSLTADPRATEFWLNVTGYNGGAKP